MILAEFQMFPTDVGESKSKYVAQVIDLVDKSGLVYQLTPMGTIVEGSWDDVMALITRCYKHMESISNRISISIKVDARKGDKTRLAYKTEKIKELLKRDIST